MRDLQSCLPRLKGPGSSARIGVRHVLSRSFYLSSAKDKLMPPSFGMDEGAMVTVALAQGLGFAATADLSAAGLQRAADDALERARFTQRSGVYGGLGLDQLMPRPAKKIIWRSPVASVNHDRRPWLEMVSQEAAAFGSDPRLVYWSASISEQSVEQNIYIDGELVSDQKFLFIDPSVSATALVHGISETRHLGAQATSGCRQGGDEEIGRSGFLGSGSRAAQEAIALASAPACPSGTMDIILMPDQMMLQIHESIGHPLELDRILGDERNYAGTSFVTLDMFGQYQYGSELLNVRFDPGTSEQTQVELASYAGDESAHVAESKLLIEKGILKRPLGSALSVARAKVKGVALDAVANARSGSWRRPPIDRMANVNIEPGADRLKDMIGAIKDGVLMATNRSWSIDDSRNKFQFGCEWGQRILNGEIVGLVRSPGYRGVSASFWRSLSMLGNEETFEVMGTPNCGKGEPNQGIRVGHASPACLFRGVEVFGPASAAA